MAFERPHQNSALRMFSGLPVFHGFGGHAPHQGPHVCHIYNNDHERTDAVLEFLETGIAEGHHTLSIAGTPSDESLAEFLAEEGISLPGAQASGQVKTLCNHDFYLNEEVFDAQRLMGQWDAIISAAKGFAGIWAIADVLPELRHIQGGVKLLAYEAGLEEWMRHHQVTIVCQYDARLFDATTLMGMLRIHPLILANGRVVANPYFVPRSRSKSH